MVIPAGLFWPAECLIIKNGCSLLFTEPVNDGDILEIEFIHSLNLSPIIDVIEWNGDEFIVRKSIFKTFGAGVPIPADGIGTGLIHRDDGWYELTGIDKRLDNISILVQEIPNHKISINGREVFLLDIVKTGESIEIKVEYVPFIFRK